MVSIVGPVAVSPTPLDPAQNVDVEGIERLVELLVENDLGIFALGSAGEGMNLTFEDRVVAARKMAEVNDGRVPLLIGAGSFSVKEALGFIDAVADCNIDGVHVIPYDSKVSGEAVETLYSEIADRSPIPIWLYQKHNENERYPVRHS